MKPACYGSWTVKNVNWLMDINCIMLNFAQQTRGSCVGFSVHRINSWCSHIYLWIVNWTYTDKIVYSFFPFFKMSIQNTMMSATLFILPVLSTKWWYITFKIISIFCTRNKPTTINTAHAILSHHFLVVRLFFFPFFILCSSLTFSITFTMLRHLSFRLTLSVYLCHAPTHTHISLGSTKSNIALMPHCW